MVAPCCWYLVEAITVGGSDSCCSRICRRRFLLQSSWQSCHVGNCGVGILQKYKVISMLEMYTGFKTMCTHSSGLIFFSHGDRSASSAVMRLSGSKSSILSSRSSAGAGMNSKSSRRRRRCVFFCLRVWNRGSLITFGHTAGTGDPQIFDIVSSCAISALAWNRGRFTKSSPRMHPQDHTSIDGP